MRALMIRIVPSWLTLACAGAAIAGVVADDFDGDGRLDLLVSEAGTGGTLRLLGLQGEGAVSDLTAAHGLGAVRGAGEIRALDADDDGRLDLLVLPSDPAEALRLLVRDGDGAFRDATGRAGLAGVNGATAAVLGDLDLDGRLDLVVGTAGGEPPHVRLWTGAGDGTFREITGGSGVAASAPCAGLALGDVDFDDLPELYVSLRDAPNALWRNAGAGVFAPVEGAAPLAAPAASGAARFLDYDNDRDWDLLVSPPASGGAPRLFQNDRDRWEDVTAARGLDAAPELRRIAVGDLDNDGYEELLGETADRVVVLRNERGRGFAPMDGDPQAPALSPGEHLVVADLDHDGDQDVLTSLAADGAIFGGGAHRNPGNDHLWVSVDVRGTAANRFGVGSTVRVLAVDKRGRRRDYFRRVGDSAVSGGSLRQDVGLERADRILWLEVYFPATKEWQSYYQPKSECTIIVNEGAANPETVFRGPPSAGRRL